jgi:hypothetical protein
MHSSTKQYIDHLAEEAAAWEKTAHDTEVAVREHIHNPENRLQWEGWVTAYRKKAERCRQIIKMVGEDQAP